MFDYDNKPGVVLWFWFVLRLSWFDDFHWLLDRVRTLAVDMAKIDQGQFTMTDFITCYKCGHRSMIQNKKGFWTCRHCKYKLTTIQLMLKILEGLEGFISI